MTAAAAHEDLALVVDLGTTGIKVGLATLRGEVRWSTSRELHTEVGDDGSATQDAETWWSLIGECAREVISESGVAGSGVVAAVGVTGQWASTVPTRADGTPAGLCLLWLDTRGGPAVRRRIGGRVAGYDVRKLLPFIRATGGAPSLDGADPMGQRLVVTESLPEVDSATRWFCEPVDHITARLTGRATATAASMTGSWLVNLRRGRRLAYQRGLVRTAGADLDRLPPLVSLLSTVGPLTAEASAHLGLADRPQVITGLPDAHTAALGSGATADGAAHLSIGTTSWISCHVARPKTDVGDQMATIPGVWDDRFLVANNHETSGRALAWARDALFGTEDPPSFSELDAMAAAVPPGSGDVLFTPWLAGERSPMADKSARAGFHNVGLGATRPHLLRAVLEGVAFNDRWLHEAVEGFVGHRLDPVRMVGGGASSELWCRIHADVMDRTIEQVDRPLNAGLRGAALACGLALGAVRRDEVDSLVAIRRRFEPDPANRGVYDRLFAEYPGLYPAQKAMFRRINR